MEFLEKAIAFSNDILWSYVLIVMLIALGLWFSFRTGFVQLRLFREMLRLLREGVSHDGGHTHISSFQAFCISTASRVGVGNIAGIAIAIMVGGPGAIFWMWVIAVIGAASGFVESTLAQIYKVRDPKTFGFRGGPAYYIRNCLGSRSAAALFAVLISVTFGLCFNSVQANTITLSLQSSFGIDRALGGAGITILSAIVIFGGLKRIAHLSSWLVPVMATLYLLIALVIVLMNITHIPAMFVTIISQAFSPDAAVGGIGAAILTGAKRGLFSNEAGMGSVPNAAATAFVSHPVKQGLVQALGVFVDTLLVCTASACIVLLYEGYADAGKTGIELVQLALTSHLGSFAGVLLSFMVFLFAFSSIAGNYYYGESNIQFFSTRPEPLLIFRVLVVAMVAFGSVADLPFVWNLADLFMALMAIVNLVAIALLGRNAFIALKDYSAQKKAGIADPVFHPEQLPDRRGIEAWEEK
ncbi:alanine/glycine:cation symporter family protein [Mailhella massiliensis]|uniref:alanine/glycine:cation symporter family protein n=1 Tax=Mailhella massiliensis TaxID=1903261 RepID=UPI00097D9255|nr:alanine/glycine:cation symporter family protein [Mailhella massiliensis]